MTSSYKKLNDAVSVTGDKGFAPGKTKIWYWKPEASGYYPKGYEWLRYEGVAVPDVRSLSQSHVKVGTISERDPARILDMMRTWSPEGQADELVHELGLSHTDMTVGDIIHLPNGRLLMVDLHGFAELGQKPPRRPEVKSNRSPSPPPKDPSRTVGSLVRRLLS